MDKGDIVIHVVNGRRTPFDPAVRLLVTAMDGHQKTAVRTFVNTNQIRLHDLDVHDSPADDYTVLVAAKDHSDAGFMPVKIVKNQQQDVHLMMLRRDATFQFDPFDSIVARADLHTFLCGKAPGEVKALYEGLASDNKPGLACLLNITTALEQMTLARFDGVDQKPLRSFKALRSAPSQDRLFAWVDRRLVQQVEATVTAPDAGQTRLVKAPKGLHPGATVSYKQTDFGEGNVQLTFHETESDIVMGVDCTIVEADIDYFKDTASHILLEVFPNKLKARIHGKDSSSSLTDPKSVYGLRWIAAEQRGFNFAPPYVLQ